MRLSRTSPNMVWVASSAGRIWKIDWTTGSGSGACLKLECDLLSDLEVDVTQVGSDAQDVLLVSVSMEDKWHILACDVQSLQLQATKTVVERTASIQNLRFLWDGQVLAASSGKDIIIGTLNSPSGSPFSEHWYEVFIMDCSDDITCLDLRVAQRVHLTKQSQIETGDQLALDVVVGCARGAIFYYNDILPQLRLLHKSANITKSLQPRRLHWHRKAVHAVKWSRDGESFPITVASTSLTEYLRQLHYIWWFRIGPHPVATRYEQARPPAAFGRIYREHRGFYQGIIVCCSFG